MLRTVVIFFVQIVVSLFVTASVMPLVLITTPAAQSDARLGLTLMGGVLIVTFTLVSMAWPRRLR